MLSKTWERVQYRAGFALGLLYMRARFWAEDTVQAVRQRLKSRP